MANTNLSDDRRPAASASPRSQLSPLSSQPARFVFHLPPIGNAEIVLHNESAELYRFLEEVGEVDHQRRIDHLGLIRIAFEGAHHRSDRPRPHQALQGSERGSSGKPNQALGGDDR